jgi:Zn-dependent alcohol dehydrogenase
MEALLATGKLNRKPVITQRLNLSRFHQAMELLRMGEAIKMGIRLE